MIHMVKFAEMLINQTHIEQNAEFAKQSAIVSVGIHANDEWMTDALRAVHQAARENHYFTTDEVWPLMDGQFETHDRRAMGAVMKLASGDGIISPTETWKESTSAINHKRPLRMWKSAIYTGQFLGEPSDD